MHHVGDRPHMSGRRPQQLRHSGTDRPQQKHKQRKQGRRQQKQCNHAAAATALSFPGRGFSRCRSLRLFARHFFLAATFGIRRHRNIAGRPYKFIPGARLGANRYRSRLSEKLYAERLEALLHASRQKHADSLVVHLKFARQIGQRLVG